MSFADGTGCKKRDTAGCNFEDGYYFHPGTNTHLPALLKVESGLITHSWVDTLAEGQLQRGLTWDEFTTREIRHNNHEALKDKKGNSWPMTEPGGWDCAVLLIPKETVFLYLL